MRAQSWILNLVAAVIAASVTVIISAATEQIIHRLKNQYTIAYYPTNEKYDGSFRYVSVTVMPKDKRKVKVFAPSGYYAPDPGIIKEEKINDK
jgi:hypothetical protein